MANDTMLIALFFLRIAGIMEWSELFFLLIEVVVCRDVRKGDISRILNSSVAVRWRLFRRSWRSLFYKGSCGILLCAGFAIIQMSSDMWLANYPMAPYTWTLVSIFLPSSIFLVYYSRGYRITLFQKFHLFMLDRHE